MTTMRFEVDADVCIRCGLCVKDCPTRVLERVGTDAPPSVRPGKESHCIQCQHCLAVCPSAAISIWGRHPANSLLVDADGLPSWRQMNLLVRSRRSVRQYLDENVPGEKIQRLLRALANAPSGVNRRAWTFRVVDDKHVMRRLRCRVYKALAGAGPRATGLGEGLSNAATIFAERGVDMIFRGAPHALIVSAPVDAPCPREDVALALAYFELLAYSAGLGTVWWGMLKMVLEALPELKPLVGLAPGEVYYGMLFGVPAVPYPRTVQRDDAARVVYIRDEGGGA